MAEHSLENIIPDNDQTQARREHLEALRALVGNVYPNKFARSNVTDAASAEDTISSVVEKFKNFEPQVSEGEKPSPDVLQTANEELNKVRVALAGRIAAPPRVMGKAAFVHLSDGTSRLQIYVRRQDVVGVRNDATSTTNLSLSNTVNGWDLFGLLDHGDFIGVEGYLFVTKTGELSVHVEKLQFLAKALLPMPDKMHGIHDAEIRQRQRYADLIAGSLKLEREEGDLTPREVFELRSKVVREIRRFLDDRDFVEVETPMLTPLATGAAARPFKTHHNALDIDLYARIAPELYLKRLVVGGFEKVYELNRNFRNEGISTKHNPEFTMLEFYAAYMDVNGMMDLCEELLRSVVQVATGGLTINYDAFIGWDEDLRPEFKKQLIDFSTFQRLSMKQAILTYWPSTLRMLGGEEFCMDWLDDPETVWALQRFWPNMESLKAQIMQEDPQANDDQVDSDHKDSVWMDAQSGIAGQALPLHATVPGHPLETAVAESIVWLFEHVVEPELIQPTFITDFPKAISPLSKASPTDPSVAERFEYFVAGLESANGFSELNDPKEQEQRFLDQVQQRERGDEEAMVMDEDYIRALSYGMPPAAGIGVGIDRLVMLLANKHSIRDVILFPHMRPERRADDESGSGQ